MAVRNPLNDRYTGDGPKGQTRKSAASAKPKRKAADTVYIKSAGTSKGKPLEKEKKTREEKRAEREKQRVESNAVYSVATVLMNNNQTYAKYKRIWWGLLGFAIVATILSWIAQFQLKESTVPAIIAVVVAYIGIIGALILDFAKIRPIRKASRERAASMSKKQLDAVLEKEVLKNQRQKLEKEMKKAAKEGTPVDEEHEEKLEKLEAAQEKADERADKAFGRDSGPTKKAKKDDEPKRDMSRANSYRRGSGK